MAKTRSTLKQISGNFDESMGARDVDLRPQLSPVPSMRDIGRRPLRKAGRVAIELVAPDPNQPRSEFSGEAISRLAESIRDKGQLLPIHVRWSADLEKWIIVSGERRWRATKQAGLPTIDCHFHEAELSGAEILEQQLVENLLREDLKPIEEAKAYSSLMNLNGWNGRQIAESLHVPPSRVSRTLALLDLPDDILQQLEAGLIAARSAYEISKLSDEETQRELADRAATGQLTHSQAEKAVRQRRGKLKPKSRVTRQTFTTEEGWKITVSAKKRGTYDEIEEALLQVLEEIRHRIRNNTQLF